MTCTALKPSRTELFISPNKMKSFPLYTELFSKNDRVRWKIGTFPMLVHKVTTSCEYFLGFNISKKARIMSTLTMQLNRKKVYCRQIY